MIGVLVAIILALFLVGMSAISHMQWQQRVNEQQAKAIVRLENHVKTLRAINHDLEREQA